MWALTPYPAQHRGPRNGDNKVQSTRFKIQLDYSTWNAQQHQDNKCWTRTRSDGVFLPCLFLCFILEAVPTINRRLIMEQHTGTVDWMCEHWMEIFWMVTPADLPSLHPPPHHTHPTYCQPQIDFWLLLFIHIAHKGCPWNVSKISTVIKFYSYSIKK